MATTQPAPRTASDLTDWLDASSWLPPDPRCVLAHDGESHFIACYENGEWSNVWTDQPIDSVILAWMELPAIPEI